MNLLVCFTYSNASRETNWRTTHGWAKLQLFKLRNSIIMTTAIALSHEF